MSVICSLPRSIILCIALFISASFVTGQLALALQTVSLTGRVTTKDGNVIPAGVTVSLESSEGMQVAQQPADSSGGFSFDGLVKQHYTLTVTCDGFEPHIQQVNLAFGANQYNVNVFLNPIGSKTVLKAAPLLSDQAATKAAVKYFEKGERALQKRNISEARDLFTKALGESPCFARALAELALTDVQEKHLADAENHFQRAIGCDGAFLDPYAELGQLYNTEGKYAQAEAVLGQGIRRSPGTWRFYERLGTVHYKMAKYQQAEQEYLRVKSLIPTPPPEVYAELANVYLKEQAYGKAFAEMMNYLRMDPNGKFAPSIKRVSQEMAKHGLISAAQAEAAEQKAADAPGKLQ